MNNAQYDTWKLASPFDDVVACDDTVNFYDFSVDLDGDTYSVDGTAIIVDGRVAGVTFDTVMVWNGEEFIQPFKAPAVKIVEVLSDDPKFLDMVEVLSEHVS